jgi:hypothetical protein
VTREIRVRPMCPVFSFFFGFAFGFLIIIFGTVNRCRVGVAYCACFFAAVRCMFISTRPEHDAGGGLRWVGSKLKFS